MVKELAIHLSSKKAFVAGRVEGMINIAIVDAVSYAQEKNLKEQGFAIAPMRTLSNPVAKEALLESIENVGSVFLDGQAIFPKDLSDLAVSDDMRSFLLSLEAKGWQAK